MIETFGNYSETLQPSSEYLTLSFSPSARPLKERWRNNGLSADFLADYFMSFMPGNEAEPDDHHRRLAFKAAVAYIANELLENAMKYVDGSADQPISLKLELDENLIRFIARNSVSLEGAARYKAFIQELLAADPSDFFVRQMEQQAEGAETACSGLGFITMINDYTAELGWKFEPGPAPSSAQLATTQVSVRF